uniref:UmuC domain-containing protein n=1 Tax=Corethron hystrix TaxID=216773 RepID=A0A6U5M9N7_9STRA|mmetsp:Transcript_8352/g.18234  ORF Transcript_8352/g.18234 Transcript_8352/m.18234 type:complete len:688 (+) Transcript_8352:61-2124(+)
MKSAPSQYFDSLKDEDEEISDSDDDACWSLKYDPDNEQNGHFSGVSDTSPCKKDMLESKSASRPDEISYPSPPMRRMIVHLDVDCFYCQCEAIDDSTGLLDSCPFAIGQKHIIVTCNYVARKLGVKKLMSKRSALEICPRLKIIDGSDLARYRTQSRNIYMAFRNAVKSLGGGDGNQVCRGGMDEMFADITASVDFIEDVSVGLVETLPATKKNTFVYGNQSGMISISEDQSGASTTIYFSAADCCEVDGVGVASASSCSARDQWGSKKDREICIKRLEWASDLAHIVKRKVYEETKFKTCCGISVSPMLAKIASDLKKPDSLNVLYPWRSMNILESMPLRKIPQLGSQTLKILNECLEEENQSRTKRDDHWWTCRDLLSVPQYKVVNCLKKSKQFRMNCEQHASSLIQKCQGIDSRAIIDDEGRVSKTVSVEDSFRRGSIMSRLQIFQALEPILVRLPKLLEERRQNSALPSLAFPNTVRVSMRNLTREDETSEGTAKGVCTTRQQKINGQLLMETSNESERVNILRSAVVPLIHEILDKGRKVNDDIQKNFTRINIAVTNFSDNKEDGSKHIPVQEMMSITSHFPKMKRKMTHTTGQDGQDGCVEMVASQAMLKKDVDYRLHGHKDERIPDGIDPDVLKELPADVVKEILSQRSTDCRRFQHRQTIKKKKGIEAFFCLQSKREKN